jgi:hypothetical protein
MCSLQAVPKIIRHLFASDEIYKTKLPQHLSDEYGEYEKFDYDQLILPLSETGTESPSQKRSRGTGDSRGPILFK